MKKHILYVAAVCLLQHLASAQNLQGGSQTTWTLRSVGNNTPFTSTTDLQTKRSIVHLSETEQYCHLMSQRVPGKLFFLKKKICAD